MCKNINMQCNNTILTFKSCHEAEEGRPRTMTAIHIKNEPLRNPMTLNLLLNNIMTVKAYQDMVKQAHLETPSGVKCQSDHHHP